VDLYSEEVSQGLGKETTALAYLKLHSLLQTVYTMIRPKQWLSATCLQVVETDRLTSSELLRLIRFSKHINIPKPEVEEDRNSLKNLWLRVIDAELALLDLGMKQEKLDSFIESKPMLRFLRDQRRIALQVKTEITMEDTDPLMTDTKPESVSELKEHLKAEGLQHVPESFFASALSLDTYSPDVSDELVGEDATVVVVKEGSITFFTVHHAFGAITTVSFEVEDLVEIGSRLRAAFARGLAVWSQPQLRKTLSLASYEWQRNQK